MRKLALIVAGLLAALAPAGRTLAAADVYVVHGIPGTRVDVYVNDADDPALPGFGFGGVAGPITLADRDCTVDVYPAGSDPSVTDPLLRATATIADGQRVAVVAHLNEAGKPVLSYVRLDPRPAGRRDARLGLRHLAAAPAIDAVIVASGYSSANGSSPAARFSVDSGAGISTDVPAGPYAIFLTLPGSDDRIFPPASPLTLRLRPGRTYVAYAVGAFPKSLTLIVQELEPEPPAQDPGDLANAGEDDDADDDEGGDDAYGPDDNTDDGVGDESTDGGDDGGDDGDDGDDAYGPDDDADDDVGDEGTDGGNDGDDGHGNDDGHDFEDDDDGDDDNGDGDGNGNGNGDGNEDGNGNGDGNEDGNGNGDGNEDGDGIGNR